MPNLNITNLQNQLNTPDTDSIMKDSNLRKAYQDYLTNKTDTSSLPTPENIIPQTIQGIKNSSGIIPKIVTGLGGIINLANTSAGHRLVSQAMGGDVEHKTAMENVAQKKQGIEQNSIAQIMAQEAARTKALTGYGEKEMEIEAAKPYKDMLAESQMATMKMAQEKAPGEIERTKAETERIKNEPEVKKQAEFADKRKAIYEANKDISGAEVILDAKNDNELNSIVIKHGLKLPLLGKFGGSVESKPMTATNPKTGERKQSLDGGTTWQTIK